MWMARLLGLPELIALQIGDQPFPVLSSIIRGAVLVVVLSLLSGRKS